MNETENCIFHLTSCIPRSLTILHMYTPLSLSLSLSLFISLSIYLSVSLSLSLYLCIYIYLHVAYSSGSIVIASTSITCCWTIYARRRLKARSAGLSVNAPRSVEGFVPSSVLWIALFCCECRHTFMMSWSIKREDCECDGQITISQQIWSSSSS
jgi:hypothetical protein